MKQILVTGCRGQLGNELQLLAPQYADTCRFHFTDREELDITDRRAVFDFIESHSIAIVINCAAYTAVDRAEEDKSLCMAVNVTGVRNLASAAAENGICNSIVKTSAKPSIFIQFFLCFESISAHPFILYLF